MAQRAQLLDVRLGTPDGEIAGRIALPDGPLRLAELAAAALPLVDRYVDLAARRERRGGREISCRIRCTACCHHLVPVSPPEAWLLDELMRSHPAASQRALAERFAGVVERLRDAGLLAALEEPASGDAGALSARYFALRIPCAFLESDACSIYPLRPSACREYLVTSPAERCWTPLEGGVARVGVSMRASLALARLCAELCGGEPELIPLPLAPAWAARHRALGERSFDARAVLTRLLELLGAS